MPHILTIAGSPSSQSKSTTVLDQANDYLKSKGIETITTIVRDLPAQELIFGRYDSPAIQQEAALVKQAEGIIIATPVYKAAYSGVLKAFLDLLPSGAFAGKVILPIATGAAVNHALMLDYSFKPLLFALGAEHILNGLYLLDSQWITDGGITRLEPETDAKFRAALDSLAAAVV
jgi:FMN reductase